MLEMSGTEMSIRISECLIIRFRISHGATPFTDLLITKIRKTSCMIVTLISIVLESSLTMVITKIITTR